MVTIGNFFFRFRTTLSPLLPFLLLLPGPRLLADPLAAALLGLFVALLGQVIRAATIGLRYIVRGGRGHRVYADDLVTEGLFEHTRNPLYVGKFLMVLGTGLGSNRSTALVAIVLAYCFMYHAITLAEEAYLRGRFGAAFDEYCRRVPRYWPRLRGLGATLAKTQFNWSRVLTKEYSAPLGWTLPIVLIGAYNLHRDGRPEAATVLWIILAAVTAFWIAMGLRKRLRLAPESSR